MNREKRYIVFLIFVLYLAILLKYTVFRVGWNSGSFFSGRFNFELMSSYQLLISHKAWLRVIYLFGGNIIGFIPFGIYIRGVCKWKIITVTFVGLLFSVFIELMQFVLGTGITEIDDLILNTTGVFLGACITKYFYCSDRT